MAPNTDIIIHERFDVNDSGVLKDLKTRGAQVIDILNTICVIRAYVEENRIDYIEQSPYVAWVERYNV